MELSEENSDVYQTSMTAERLPNFYEYLCLLSVG